MLKHLMVEIYDGCNFKCNMCTIWTNKGRNIDLVQFEKFLDSVYCKGLESVGITGGEPMMSNQLDEIASILNRFENIKTIYITSNGSFSKRLIEFVGAFQKKNVCVNISIDGVGEIHNKIRGINVFDTAIKTIGDLKDSGLVHSLGIKMTVQISNMDKIMDVYLLSKNLGVGFGLMPMVSTDAYFENSGKVDTIKIALNTSEGDKFRLKLLELQKKVHKPYIDMLCDLYSGKERDMRMYGCLFPSENNILYADGKLGLCFITGRKDVSKYLNKFESYEAENKNFREFARTDLLAHECKNCSASCAADYDINLVTRVINKIRRQL